MVLALELDEDADAIRLIASPTGLRALEAAFAAVRRLRADHVADEVSLPDLLRKYLESEPCRGQAAP